MSSLLKYSLHNQNITHTLHITEGSMPPVLLDMQNTSGKVLVFRELTGTVDASNHHLALRFPAGAIIDANLGDIALSNSHQSRWEMGAPVKDGQGNVTCYFCLKDASGQNNPNAPTLTLAANGVVHLMLRNVEVNGTGKGARTITTELSAQNIHYQGETTDVEETIAQDIRLVNHRGNPYLPLHAGFGDSHTVLNDGTPSSVVLHLTNEGDEAVHFHYDAQEASNTSKLLVSFAASDHNLDHAIGSKADEAAIVLTPPAGWTATQVSNETSAYWVLEPQSSAQILRGGQTLDVALSDIRTNHPVGFANIYVDYQNVRDAQGGHYRDGQLRSVLQKKPLVYRNDKVGIGADAPSEKLEVAGSIKATEKLIANALNTQEAWVGEAFRQLTTEKLQVLPANTPETEGQAGFTVAIEGDHALVGVPAHLDLAPAEGETATAKGAVYAFERAPDGTWHQTQVLQPDDLLPKGRFGHAVAMRNGQAIVGAPEGDAHKNGATYFFKLNAATGQWENSLGRATLEEEFGNNARFGFSVAMEGNRAIIGAQGVGAIVLEYNSEGWNAVGNIILKRGNGFGYSVAVQGKYVLMGAPDESAHTGAAYLFEQTGDDWQQVQEFTGAGQASYFGRSVALTDTHLVIGAIYDRNNPTQTRTGAAYIYQKQGNDWVLQQRFEGRENANFGQCVALSGEYLAVGEPSDHAREVHLYQHQPQGWAKINTLADPGNERSYFGIALAFAGNELLIGASAANAVHVATTAPALAAQAGKVGIGTPRPTEALEVAGNTKTHALILTSPDGSEWKVTVNNDGVLRTEPVGGFGPM